MNGKKVKEPIRKPWIWIVLVIIVMAGVPWYLPRGTFKPIILGFPYWAAISVIMSIALAAYITYLCKNEWNILEDEEELQKKGTV